jgi:argininosuccinate synthase
VALRALDPTLTVLVVPGDPGPVASPAAPLRLESPTEPALVDISFSRGEPTAINGVTMPLVELLDSLGMIAGAHGIGPAAGRAPALLVLSAAHLKLQALAGTDDLGGMMQEVTRHYADIIANGLWFSRFRKALDAFVDKTQETLNGVVRLKLFKADCQAIDVAQAPTAGRMLPLVGTND